MTWDEWHSVVVVHIHALVHLWAPLQTTAETCAGLTVSSYVKCVALEDMICWIKMKTISHEAEKTTNVTTTTSVLTVRFNVSSREAPCKTDILTNKTFRSLKSLNIFIQNVLLACYHMFHALSIDIQSMMVVAIL